MLKIIDLSKSYDNKKMAVDHVSLEIEAKDIFAFIGPNGAGKTTTIKSIVGILPIDHGDILIDNVSIKADPIACKKMMAYIPDNPNIYDNLTGKAFLNFICDIYGVDIQVRIERINKYSEIFDMTSHLNEYISSYSHGMKQKLIFISAFIHDAKILVLDEPFVGLDPVATHQVKELMKEFCESGGAIFFSTHVLEVAERLCNKVAIIKDGKIVISGLMNEVTQNADLEKVFLEQTDHA